MQIYDVCNVCGNEGGAFCKNVDGEGYLVKDVKTIISDVLYDIHHSRNSIHIDDASSPYPLADILDSVVIKLNELM